MIHTKPASYRGGFGTVAYASIWLLRTEGGRKESNRDLRCGWPESQNWRGRDHQRSHLHIRFWVEANFISTAEMRAQSAILIRGTIIKRQLRAECRHWSGRAKPGLEFPRPRSVMEGLQCLGESRPPGEFRIVRMRRFFELLNESVGILTFPSVHAAVASLCAWAAWKIKMLRYPALALNIAMAFSAVPSASHYLTDILAGVGVAAFSIASIVLLTKETSPKTEPTFARYTFKA